MVNNNQHCLASIRSNYGKFSDKEKSIADFILANPQGIIHHTINQVSDKLGVAESTIFRFCQRIGFKGFQAMKISLASEVVTPIKDIHEKITEADSIKMVSEKVFRSNIKTIEDTFYVQDETVIENAVDRIIKAKKVHFFGSGGSAVVAMDAYHKFIRSGIDINANLEAHMQIMAASQLSTDDLAILISHSGSTKDVLDILQILKGNNVPTIAITNFAKSPLTKEADTCLYTVAEETDFRSEALSSRIAQLTIIDALYTNVMIANNNSGQKALQNMRRGISLKRL